MKNIKINKKNIIETLKKGKVFGAGISFAFALLLSNGCTQTEIDEVNEIIEQLNQGEVEVVTPEVNPIEQDPIEVTPVEPEIVEPEIVEINPMDMSAKYNLDFETPIYTEEEIAEATEIIMSDEVQASINDYDGKSEKEVDNNIRNNVPYFYKSNQDFAYMMYNSTKDINIDAINSKHSKAKNFYYDEENDWLYVFEENCIEIYCDNNSQNLIIIIYNDKENYKDLIGTCFSKEEDWLPNYVGIGPGAAFYFSSQDNVNGLKNNNMEIYNIQIQKNDNHMIVSYDEMVENGFIPIELEQKTLVK